MFNNGVIAVGAENTSSLKTYYRVIQNYSNLTLNNMEIKGENLMTYDDFTNSVIESCNGTVSLTGSTKILDVTGGANVIKAVNVDAWNGAYPAGTQLTVNLGEGGQIGTIHCFTEGSGTAAPSTLQITAGTVGALTVAEGSTVAVTKAESATVAAPEGYTWVKTPDGNFTLSKLFVVTFVTGEGASAAPEAQVILPNGKATKPISDPEKGDECFKGWFAEDAEEAFDFDTVITGDITLTARFGEHSYGEPEWTWNANGSMKAYATYTCADCGEKLENQEATVVYEDSKGVRTFTATDAFGNVDTHTQTLSYTVKFNGILQPATYQWGDICTLTATENSKWYYSVADGDSTHEVADGTTSYSFAVTGNVSITTEKSSYEEQQPVVYTTINSPAAKKAEFQAKWSVPAGSTIKSVAIYRGNTGTDKEITAETLLSKGTRVPVNLYARNGDYLLKLSNLTTGKYQHAIIVIEYIKEGEQEVLKLVSEPVRTRIQ